MIPILYIKIFCSFLYCKHLQKYLKIIFNSYYRMKCHWKHSIFVNVCYIVICWFMQKYTYICWIHTDPIIIKTHDDKVARTNDARKEDAGRLLYKIFYLSSLFVSFERVVQSLHVRGSWRPNITEIFWPRSYGRQRCVFLVLHGCSTGPWSKLFCVLAFPTTRVYLRLSLYCLPSLSPISNCPQFVGLILPSNSHAVI